MSKLGMLRTIEGHFILNFPHFDDEKTSHDAYFELIIIAASVNLCKLVCLAFLFHPSKTCKFPSLLRKLCPFGMLYMDLDFLFLGF